MSQVLKDKTFLNTFWSLAEDEIDNRVKGGSTLVNILIEQQRIHEKGDVSVRRFAELGFVTTSNMHTCYLLLIVIMLGL